MSLVQLSTKALAEIQNGLIAAALDRELKAAVRDITDRTRETGARKVHLTVELRPKFIDDAGEVSDVDVSFKIRSQTPVLKSKDYTMAVRGKQHLAFNDLSPANPHQATFDALAADPPADGPMRGS